jgi:hypothetical protein
LKTSWSANGTSPLGRPCGTRTSHYRNRRGMGGRSLTVLSTQTVKLTSLPRLR